MRAVRAQFRARKSSDKSCHAESHTRRCSTIANDNDLLQQYLPVVHVLLSLNKEIAKSHPTERPHRSMSGLQQACHSCCTDKWRDKMQTLHMESTAPRGTAETY